MSREKFSNLSKEKGVATTLAEQGGSDRPVPPPALEARDLTLSWDGSQAIARDITLTVQAGEVVCMVGRSGCGKTTILHALAGLTQPLSGQVLVGGRDRTGQPGNVSYMFQKDLLLPSKRVLDNVCLPLLLAGASKKEAREKALPLLDRFGLAGTQDRWPAELSGGMRQRAAFLRTYLMGNEVILLDEPFSALDAITRTDMRSWFAAMACELGLATLMITHDVDEACAMASRVYVLAGDPAGGVPSRVAGVVETGRASDLTPSEYELTGDFLEAKRQVLALLEEKS